MKNVYLLAVSVVFICGVVLASYGVFASFSPVFLFPLALAFFLCAAFFVKKSFLFSAILVGLVFILGVIRYETYNHIDSRNIRNFISYPSKKTLVTGKVQSDPVESRSGRKKTFVLKAHSVESARKRESAGGFMLINLYGSNKPRYRYGDVAVLEGYPAKPFFYGGKYGFDYVKYLANKRIYTVMNVKKGFFSGIAGGDKRFAVQIIRGVYSVRNRMAARVKKFLKAPYDSVLLAVLLGKREKIPPWLNDLFAKTGTLHILAISGLHVGIIYFALRVILKIFRIPKNASIILSVAFLALFTILAGGRPSVLRAAAMFSILAFGEMLKRKISVFNLLGLSCLAILIVCPNQVFDLGFVFSYAAVLSIVTLAPVFYGIFYVGAVPGPAAAAASKVRCYFLRSISVSLAAWLGLLPLLAYYFGLISPVVVIANLVVIPLVLMVMVSGLFFLTLGFLAPFLASIFAQSAWFFIFLLIKSAEIFKSIPFGYFTIEQPAFYGVPLYYTTLFIMVAGYRVFRRKNQLFHF